MQLMTPLDLLQPSTATDDLDLYLSQEEVSAPAIAYLAVLFSPSMPY